MKQGSEEGHGVCWDNTQFGVGGVTSSFWELQGARLRR